MFCERPARGNVRKKRRRYWDIYGIWNVPINLDEPKIAFNKHKQKKLLQSKQAVKRSKNNRTRMWGSTIGIVETIYMKNVRRYGVLWGKVNDWTLDDNQYIWKREKDVSNM